jgi:hypothetical protein
MKSAFAALVALSLIAASPASASDANQADFQVGGVSFSLPIPDGYCLPIGEAADVMAKIAAADAVNTTDLALMRCDGKLIRGANEYTTIKTPSAALLLTIDRPTLLAQLGPQFDQPLDKSWRDLAAKSLSKLNGSKIDITGDFGPRGKDAICGYLAGILHFTADAASFDQPVAMCMTAVGGRVLSIYRGGTKTDEASILALMREARAIALAIKQTASK